MSKEKFQLNWYDFEACISEMVQTIEENDINHIVSIYRGGLPLGVRLSNQCKLPLSIVKFQSYDGVDKDPQLLLNAGGIQTNERSIIIDDIADTGRSIQKVLDMNLYKNPLVYTMVGNHHIPADWKFYLHQLDRWIIFPWEE